MTNQERQMTDPQELQRSIEYLAGRPEVPSCCPRCRVNKTHLTSWGKLACRECSDHFTLAPKPEMAGGIVIPKAGALPEAPQGIASVESGRSYPSGTLTRAMRQRRAEQELLAVKRDFWRTIGRGRR